MYILHIHFCAISLNRTQNLHFPKIFGNIEITASLSKLCLQKIYQYHLVKYVYCMQNFVQFHAVESEIELPQEFWEKRNSSALY